MTTPPRWRVVAVLLAGRGAFRATVVLSAPVLLALWGGEVFAPYAVAVGTTLVLNPLVGSGAEKSAGMLLGRAVAADGAADAGRLLGAHLVVGAVIAAGSLAGAAVLAWPARTTGLYLLAAATQAGFGAIQALVAYWRVLGRPYPDAVSHGALAVATGLGVALVAVAGAGPRTVLGLQALAAASVAGLLAVALRRRVARPARRDVAVTARTTALMGANTLLATAAVSVVFAVLAWRGLDTAASHLYLAVVGYTVVANLLDYLLRVFQPWLAAALTRGAPAMVRTAERASRLGLALVVPASGAAVLVLGRSLGGPAEAVATVAVATPALLAVAALVWLLENLDTGALVGTVLAGALGLTGTAIAVAVLPASSAVAGGVLALLAGAALTALGLLPVLRRRLTGRPRNHSLVLTLGRHP